MKIHIKGNDFELLPEKAVYWSDTATLLIADLHLGKVTHFRKEGIAIPSVALENNFHRLDSIVARTKAERILLLGDLFHSRYNKEWERFSEWRNKHHAIEIQIVIGNHDILPQHLFHECNLAVRPELEEDGFMFTHHPVSDDHEGLYVFCGHVHPVYCLRSSGKQHIKLPCFTVDPAQMILPSFGVFTGGYEMEIVPGRKVYVIVGDNVMEV